MQVNCLFHFVPKFEERTFCKPWLKIRPPYGLLTPGQSVDVFFDITVGPETARVLRYVTALVVGTQDPYLRQRQAFSLAFVRFNGAKLPYR